MIPLLRTLASASDAREVGGKAAVLSRLMALRESVPDGVVLTCRAFDLFCASRNGAASTHLITLPLPAEIETILVQVAADLWLADPDAALVVRSSAVGEDSEAASFAGQLDSILNVHTLDELRHAVRQCWASYESERARFYRSARGSSLDGMGVVIQRQIDASVSGVLFTVAPAPAPSGDRDVLAIEYCRGLADGLVSGRTEPERLLIARRNLSIASGTISLLTGGQIRELCTRALALESTLGRPQDIEWTIDGAGRLWFVQSRPITTRQAGSPTVLWSNANVNENFPAPISPLLYSIASLGYYHYFRNLGVAFGVARWRLDAMERPLRSIVGAHGARIYYNVTSIHAVLRMAPFGRQLAEAFNQFTGVGEIADPPASLATWADRRGRAPQFFELARIAVQTTKQYVGLGRKVRAFETTADDFAAATADPELRARSLQRLLDDLDAFMDIRCHRWTNASLADTAAMISYALLQHSLKKVSADAAIHNRLLRALPGVPSSVPPIRLWALSRTIRSDVALRTLFTSVPSCDVMARLDADERFAPFRRDLMRFLDEWGFRSSSELMLTVPSLREEPRPVIELLKRYSESDGEAPEATLAQQAEERRQETSRLWRAIWRRPFRAAAVAISLRWTQRAVGYRERVRLKQALLYARCRQIALAIGDRLVAAGAIGCRDDVFMLTWAEISELGAGRAMFPHHVADLVAVRRRAHDALSMTQPADSIRLPEGGYLPPAHVAPAVAVGEPADTIPGESAIALHGASACGGRVTARAAILSGMADAARLERGDILITRQTDPGWAPLFCLVSGLVIERGGMLSHGAIIAREFGLPCVTGVAQATTRIRHGARVTVDGDRGVCLVLAGESTASV